jgi:hypothetical protein
VTPERVGISEATLIAGIPKRTLQAFAAAGGIPGAGKPAGRWTFDVEQLRRWARTVNRKAPCPISTSAAKPGGRVSRCVASNTDEAYARLLGLKQSAA